MHEKLLAFNQRLYDGTDEISSYLARPYHQLRLKLVLAEVEREIIKKQEAHILDLGCGSGEKLIPLINRARVFGVDIAPQSVQKARENGVDAVIADVEVALPFASKSFDVVVATELIEHLLDTERFLHEVHRVLKYGGLFVLTTPNLARLVDRVRFLFGYSPRQTLPMHPYLTAHVRPFTYSSLRNCLEATGFGITKVQSNYVHLDPTGRTNLMSRFLAQVVPTWGGSLIVCARPWHYNKH